MLSVLLALAVPAHAVLIEVDLATPGDGRLTLDTDSGLEWLDITESAGLSVAHVLGQFGPGGQFAGFRYATNAELSAFISGQGLTLGTTAGDSLSPILSLFGSTFSQPVPGGSVIGFEGFSDDQSPGSPGRALFQLRRLSTGFNTTVRLDADTALGTDARRGHFLVRSVVPEPSTAVLVGFGLAALARSRRSP